MNDQQRAARVAELWDLRHRDPATLITLYRNTTGLGADGELPHGVGFAEMISAIVDKESVATVTLACPNCEHMGPKDLILRRPWPAGVESPQGERLYYVCPQCKAEYPVPK
jgi:hypothetical protein